MTEPSTTASATHLSSSSARIPAASGIRLALRVTERELRFFRFTWRASAFTAFVGPVLYLLALGIGLGGIVEDRPDLQGLDYDEFIAPGLMIGAAAQLAANSGLWSIMAGHRWVGFHRAMVSTPIGPQAVAGGILVWVASRALVQAAVFGLVAIAMGAMTSWWVLAAILVAALTAVSFAAPLMANTARLESDHSFDPIMRLGIVPLYLFSGSFFPTDSLPTGLLWLVRAFPLWHGVELARVATSEWTGTFSPIINVGVISAWILVGWIGARYTFVRRLTP